MEQNFKELQNQFDDYILEIKETKVYKDYIYAKQVLQDSAQATHILSQVKELTKAKHNCKKNKQVELVKDLEVEIENFNLKYDLLFEVVQFNHAYDKLVELVNEIKYDIEDQIN